MKPANAGLVCGHKIRLSQDERSGADSDQSRTLERSIPKILHGFVVDRLTIGQPSPNDYNVVKLRRVQEGRCRRDLDAAARRDEMSAVRQHLPVGRDPT